MGVLNVTPDSFSDGGRYATTDAAVAHAVEMVRQGADLVDVGGESTRPGAVRVDQVEEQRRAIPVIRELCARGIKVSIDTMRSQTANAAVRAGATVVNDVSGGLADPAMAGVVAQSGLPYVVMHWRGHSATMNARAAYRDAAKEVREELLARVDALAAGGMPYEQMILDPGLGFAKDARHNWQVLAGLDGLIATGFPILVGASRKRFVGALLPEGAPMEERDAPTAVISALAARAGAWAVRVHDPASTRRALDVVEAWQAGAR
ncbi:MAG TPA: dihydropteroate synthase [Microbacteriaceae bacterium]|nr:dihydropteroate synthase [Microbacteriaceae bacterium]